MDKELPSVQMALKALSQSGCSEKVIEHCKTVSVLAVQIAKACEKKGFDLDLKLIQIGALLHDIGRSKTHSINHVIEGAKIAWSLNLPNPIISIIERHAGGGISVKEARKLGWPLRSYLPQTLEEKIVTYADKLVEGFRIVPLKNTLKKLSKALGANHSSVARVKNLHKEFLLMLGDFDVKSHTA